MKLIRESVEVFSLDGKLTSKSEEVIGKFLESCGRVCYKSEPKITDDSYKKFLSKIISSGHESILEHVNISAKIVTNRGVTHEIVRHRLGNYSQESTRYCNYSSNRFGNEITIIIPAWISDDVVDYLNKSRPGDGTTCPDEPAYRWFRALEFIEKEYLNLLSDGWTPEKAREILPNSLATTIMTSFNVRQWRHVLRQRLDKKCHPQMRYTMLKVAKKFNEYLPLFFSDIFCDVAMSITKEHSVFVDDAFKIIKEDVVNVGIYES